MNKGVINLYRYREVALAANNATWKRCRWSRIRRRPIVRSKS